MSFYAYIHCKPDGTPFYVGKGNETRVKRIERQHNPHHRNTINKYGKDNILVGKFECSTEDISFDLERGLIKRLRKMGVSIVNLTEGGDGASGAVRSIESRAKMSQAQLGNKKSLGKRLSKEARDKIAVAKIGNQWNCGRKYSLETKIKKSRSKGGYPIECEKDGVVLTFPTLAEACNALGFNGPNVINHMKRKSLRKSTGVKGWKIKRIQP